MVATDGTHFRDHVPFGDRIPFGERSPFNERFAKLIRGHWLDSIGNSIIVSKCAEEEDELTAVLTPLIDHPDARDRVLTIRHGKLRNWRCGNANLEWADEKQQRLVWVTDDGRRSIWSRTPDAPEGTGGSGSAFPWLLNNALPEPWLPLDVPRDILYDGARVAALLDIRQMIGPRSEPQERLTHILMDHDLHPMRGDYLIPGAESPLWQTLPVSDSLRRSIAQRIHRIPHEALSQRVSWSGETEVWVGHHKISCRARDIQALESRWVLPPKDERKPLEIARLLALYSVFDNPLSNRRSGVHLGLDPELRRQCDYELFASPLNAAVSNGRFASKWPHVEWRFGSIGAYPSVLSFLPVNSIVCVNPPFTEAYLADVMARLSELKLRF
uniref:PCIF1 WW domain-containing protein n=1 Tax=Pyrodinium bahamense TaxID=73915 RepID=A0A7S0BC65_9DINO|mmetsp:Transcript_9341/g.26280  ORF Transcript_9341/g.26280 Transcript_9341/m.26280 type:complete len:385 (+) Transcript_9341:242-1396(+)